MTALAFEILLSSGAFAFLLKKLTLNQTPVITVTGKAFFDVGHSLKDRTGEAIFPATLHGRFTR